jgi:hypothetical protein
MVAADRGRRGACVCCVLWCGSRGAARRVWWLCELHQCVRVCVRSPAAFARLQKLSSRPWLACER